MFFTIPITAFIVIAAVLLLSISANSFQPIVINTARKVSLFPSTRILTPRDYHHNNDYRSRVTSLGATVGDDRYDDDKDDVREYARIRRGRGRRRDDEERDDQFQQQTNEQKGTYYDEDEKVYKKLQDDYDDEYFDIEDDEDYDEENDDDDEEYDLFSDVLVPNPILDSIDPDGASERFPELAQDPKFWIDMLLFVAFLDFVAYAGPRNPFPDLPYF